MSKNTDLGNLVNGLFVNSSGNVGVGTTTPANALVVDRGNATASYLQFTAGTTTGVLSTDGFEVGIDASGNGIISQQENLPLMIYTNAAERMRISAAGNVGIANTSPDTSYDAGSWFSEDGLVVGNITSTSGIQINSSPTSTLSAIRFGDGDGANNLYDQGFIIYNHNLNRMTLGANRSSIMHLVGGNVGIGTSSPNTTLEVVGGNNLPPSTGTQNYTLALRDPTSMVAGVGGSIILQGFKTSTSAIGNFAYIAGKKENGTAGNESGFLSFGTFDSSGNPAERMRIASGGNVGIGTTSPNSRLQIGSMVAYTGSGYTFAMGNGTTDFLITVNAAQTGSSVTFYSSTDYYFNRSGPSSTGIINAFGFNKITPKSGNNKP